MMLPQSGATELQYRCNIMFAGVASARNHEIERKPYLYELGRHTDLVAKKSSNKDIQFTRIRPAGLADTSPAAGLVSAPPPQPPSSMALRPDSWRSPAGGPDKVKVHKPSSAPITSRAPSQQSMRHLTRANKFNGQMMNESRNKETRELAHKFSPGYDSYKEPMMGYRDQMWDGKEVMRSRPRNSRSRERDFVAPRGIQVEERGTPREVVRGTYDDRYRHRASPPPQHFQNRPVIEEARRGYRGDRPDIPVDPVDKPRGYPPDDYMRPSARDRPSSLEELPYEHPGRTSRYASNERFRTERRLYTEYDRPRSGEEMRASQSPHFSGRYSSSPPPYARGGMESGAIPFAANRRLVDTSRQFEPDLPVGGRRMESDMPVGGRRMNEGVAEVPPPPRMHMAESLHTVRRRIDDVHLNRGRVNNEIATIREPMDVDRPMNRDMGDHFRERREYRTSPSPGRPRSGYVDNYEPRGGAVPPYGMGAHVPERNSSPMRAPARGPVPDSDMRRTLASPPRQTWNPWPEFGRQTHGEGPPHREYGPPRRAPPPFRGSDEPPPPGIEAEMRREMEERGRKKSPRKLSRSPIRPRRSTSRSLSRSKIRRSISPRKVRASKQREPSGGGRSFPPAEDRGGAGWPLPRGSPVPAPSAPTGREVWIDEHAPIRSRIDDGPDCRLIINKKRSSAYPEENDPVENRPYPSSSGREERRHISPPKVLNERDRGMHMNEEMMRDRELGRMKYGRGGERARGGGGRNKRSGPPQSRMHGGPRDKMARGTGRQMKKPVFDRLDSRRGHWPPR